MLEMQRVQLLLVKGVSRRTVKEEADVRWLVKHVVICCGF
jgi:hypothetical protein